MSMLIEGVPDSLLISGTRYSINTNYRVWIKFENLLDDSADDDSEEILEKIFSLIFKEKIPEVSDEAVDKILWFYKCGKDNESKSGKRKKEIFSYDYDDGFIVAAFKQQYDLELHKEDLHWWVFHAYMLALSEDTEFVKIMGYRVVEINSKMSAAQRNYYQKMKAHYKLPVKKELQDEYNQIEEALLNGKPLDGLL